MRMFICDSATMPRCCFFALTAWTIPPCAQKMKNKRNLIYETYCYYCSFVFVIYFCVFIHTQFWLLLDSFFSTLSLPLSLSVSIRLRFWLSFLCVTKCWSNCKSLEAANKLNHCMSCDRLYLIMNYNFPERTIFNNIHERNLLKQQNFKKNIHKYTREKR